MQHRVQQRRMHAERPCLSRVLLREADLGVHVRAASPHCGQAAERRPVVETVRRPPLVEAVQRDRLRAGRRPHRRVEWGIGGRRLDRQMAAGMPCPRPLLLIFRPRVHAHRPASPFVRAAQPHLHLDAAVFGQRQRRGNGQIVHPGAADLVTGSDRQLKERRRRHHHPARHHVIGQPRMRPRRQPAGEEHLVAAGQLNGRSQHGVTRRSEPGGGDIPGSSERRPRPVPPTLEGVGGQLHLAGAREHGPPIERHPMHMQLGQRRHHRALLIPIPAQHRHQHRAELRRPRLSIARQARQSIATRDPTRARVRLDLRGKGVLRHRGQHPIGAQLQIGPYALSLERADAVGKADRAADLVHPVARRAQLLGRGRLAGQGGDDRNLRRVVAEPARQRAEVFQHWVHQRRVERVRDPQPPRSDPLGFQRGGHLKHRLLDPGDHQRGRTVHRRDRHLMLTPGQQVGNLLLGRLDRDHRPARRQRLHQPRPGRHQRTRVTQ